MINFFHKKIPLWILLVSLLAGMSLAVIGTRQFTSKESSSIEEGGLMRSDTALQESQAGERSTDKIMILYTNDVHCSIEAGEKSFGLSDLKDLKNWAEKVSEYVTLVDCGDAVQGNAVGTLSEGEYMV
ncbi:MAG: hypothetical protein K2N55_00575, partial [Lachnospiraceae bacterium]|nr:hypothetical protein [Lachnospiraceae bacterium]